MAKTQVLLYDTTLRDGAQREGISLTVDDKLKIVALLDELGIHYIEGGYPGSNVKDREFFERVREMDPKSARIAAFGMTCRVGSQPCDDANIQALIASEAPVITLVGKSWTLHVTDVIRTTLEENLRIIRESVAYCREQGREAIYDAEHFFDGYKADPDYAIATLQAAVDGGTETLVLCDTNGGAMPWEVEAITRATCQACPDVLIGIHTHNDGDVADANTLAGIRAGAVHVQGTINGYGERCGNSNLCSVIPALELKMGLQALPEGNLVHLTHIARAVASVANQSLYRQAPYVGHSAFAHKGGMHVSGMRRNPLSYQHIDPVLVGNEARVLVSEMAGKSNLQSKAEEAGIGLEEIESFPALVEKIKEMEHRGFTFDGADASVELILHRARADYVAPFEMLDFMVVVEHREGRGIFAEATIKVCIGDEVYHTAAQGNGPVNALDAALRKALSPVYPDLADFDLVDYKVHILEGSDGTGATTRVTIDTENGNSSWTTVGASPNIIEASWLALADAIEYGLITRQRNKQ
jgi:2-isopropylmalate synthase